MPPSSNTDRPLAARARRDLIVVAVSVRGERRWNLKDPLTGRFYQLKEPEYFLFERLDGQASLRGLCQEFNARFAPQRLEPQRLAMFLNLLNSEGLLLTAAADQHVALLERSRREERRRNMELWANPLAIRLPGVHPEPWLGMLHAVFRYFVAWWFPWASLLLFAAAATVLVQDFDEVRRHVPTLGEFFHPNNVLMLGLAVALTKVLHELGHALAMRQFGGHCREVGLMFLVFMPCLYCDVSDAWLLPKRWQRIVVSAAGMWVELILASICSLIWHFSQPGLVHTVCFDVMVVCSVGTVLFNANPLLRFDGYYILSDLLEIPNLAQQAQATLRAFIAQLWLGVRPVRVAASRLTGRVGLAGYALASFAYRTLLLVGIVRLLYFVADDYGARAVGGLFAILAAASFVLPAGPWVMAIWRLGGHGAGPRLSRIAVGSLAMVGLAWTVCLYPFPRYVVAPAQVRPVDSLVVYAEVPGRLLRDRPTIQAIDQAPTGEKTSPPVREGDRVKKGQWLAHLVNPAIELELVRYAGRYDELARHVELLKSRRVDDPNVARELPAAEQSLLEAQRRLEEARRDAARLSLVAPRDGVVLPPSARYAEGDPEELSSWIGTPLEPRNDGCTLEVGDMLCLIGEPDQLEVIVLVHQNEMGMVGPGQAVEIQLDAGPAQVITGKVVDLGQQLRTPDLHQPRARPPSRQGTARNRAEGAYEVRVALDSQPDHMAINALGRARITVESLSLVGRVRRFVGETFGLTW